MFKVLTGEKKRRVISPATITASIAAHLVLLGGLVYASTGNTEPSNTTDEPDIQYVELEPEEPTPPPAPVEPPPPAPADDPVVPPVPGETLVVEEVTEVPKVIPPPNPAEPPVDPRDYRGQGPIGTVIGPPTREPTEPVGPATQPTTEPFVPTEDMVEVRPVLDRNGLGRALERNYPPVLRDSRVSGRVVVQLIVDENGRPVPGSAQVIEASHPAFEAATLRAVDRFRFRPARMGGTPVAVRVTIPIVWTAQ